MTDEVEQCPFCYSEAEIIERPSPMLKWRWSVDCSKCGMSGPVEATKAEAVAAWHRFTKERDDLEKRVAVLETALWNSIETLSSAAKPSLVDPDYSPEIRELGQRIGFGALMHGASAIWRIQLQDEGIEGGEFVVGPCQSTVNNALLMASAALKDSNDDR